jgi:hypothetical protein
MDKITVDAGNYQFEIDKEMLKDIKPLLDDYKKLRESSYKEENQLTINLDGVDFPMENAVKVLQTKNEKLEGEKAALQAVCDEKKDYLSPDVVKEKVELLIKVSDVLGVDALTLTQDSEDTLRKKFIEKKLPKINTDGYSSDRLSAAFEIAEQIEDSAETIEKQKEAFERTYLQSEKRPELPKINLDEQERWSPANKTKGGI